MSWNTKTKPAPPIPSPTPVPEKPIKGVDVSSYQGVVNWPLMKNAGYKFAFAKATEGINYVDAFFLKNWNSAKDNGVYIGAYHFFHPDQDVGNQVHQFVTTMGKLRGGDLPPVLDWEVPNGVPPEAQKRAALKWLQDVEKVVGMKPIIYGSPSFFQELGDLSDFSSYSLWIAHYGVDKPRIPSPWTNWLFWQTDDAGGLDVDLFNGTVQDLEDMSFKG